MIDCLASGISTKYKDDLSLSEFKAYVGIVTSLLFQFSSKLAKTSTTLSFLILPTTWNFATDGEKFFS